MINALASCLSTSIAVTLGTPDAAAICCTWASRAVLLAITSATCASPPLSLHGSHTCQCMALTFAVHVETLCRARHAWASSAGMCCVFAPDKPASTAAALTLSSAHRPWSRQASASSALRPSWSCPVSAACRTLVLHRHNSRLMSTIRQVYRERFRHLLHGPRGITGMLERA